MDGILPLWKPKGMTSHDCVMRVRKLFKMKKVGHTGTLDPDAEGVLPICLGQATKIVPFLTDTSKVYVATAKLGTATETEDASGAVVERKDVTNPPGQDEIAQACSQFIGEITQIPPMYSAIKVNGRKLYEYARLNETVERPERRVHIYSIDLLTPAPVDPACFTIKVACGKGTYIRTLCVDIGKALGYPAHMADLVRVQTGEFAESGCVTFEKLEEAKENGSLETLLDPLLKGLTHMKRIVVDAKTSIRVKYGQKLPKPDIVSGEEPFLMMHDEELLAVYEINKKDSDEIKPVRVFNDEQKCR